VIDSKYFESFFYGDTVKHEDFQVNLRRFAFSMVVVLTACVSQSHAAVYNSWFPNEVNQASDNSAEFLVNRNGGATILDEGDILITWFQFNTLEGLTSGLDTTFGGAGDATEWTGLAAIKVAAGGKVAGTTAGRFDYTFAALDAADKAFLAGIPTLSNVTTEIAGWAAGSVVSFYDDPAKNFSRIGGPDDGGIGDVGVGPFATENALLATAVGGTRFLELGLVPAVGENIFWSADEAEDDVALVKATPAPFAGGTFNAGLNVTFNGTGFAFQNVTNLNPVSGIAGVSDWFITGGIVGVGGVNTPADAFDNFDATFHPVAVPEPTSLAIFGFGTLVAGLARLRRRKLAA